MLEAKYEVVLAENEELSNQLRARGVNNNALSNSLSRRSRVPPQWVGIAPREISLLRRPQQSDVMMGFPQLLTPTPLPVTMRMSAWKDWSSSARAWKRRWRACTLPLDNTSAET
ncbi:hypothetical_protein [Leishmania braziliensis MHOM/BR/75/M2904]|uniref:Hypothetical_protein n=1 Tax=Leishmania braziliensis MHOM/BR/75/M2904 TaxID=420245 RepID=A0A3P3ZBC5_LEIBR|nr:hypothetical_protein [Leishmania braziliensis MHOM/BR/75/M2904]